MKYLLLVLVSLMLVACSAPEAPKPVTLTKRQRDMVKNIEWFEINQRIREIRCQNGPVTKVEDPAFCNPLAITHDRQEINKALESARQGLLPEPQ